MGVNLSLLILSTPGTMSHLWNEENSLASNSLIRFR